MTSNTIKTIHILPSKVANESRRRTLRVVFDDTEASYRGN